MKTKNTQLELSGFLLILLFFTSYKVLAQDVETLKQKEKREIEYTKKPILNKMKKDSVWISYKAFRQNNTSLCENAEDPENCWNRVNLYSFLKKMADGDCESLPPIYKEYSDTCLAVNQNNCANLTGFKKLFCTGFLNRSVVEIKRAMSDPSYPVYEDRKDETAERLLNIYLGFKNNSEKDCNRFTIHNLLIRASCNMLFGNQDYERKLDSISQDIATTIVSKQYRDKDLCANNSNSAIKDACLDNSITADDVKKKFWF